MESHAILLWDSVLASCNLILIFRECLDAFRDSIPLQALREFRQRFGWLCDGWCATSLMGSTHLLIHKDRTTFHGPLPRGQLDHPLMPSTNLRQALPYFIPGLSEDFIQAGVPGNKRHVRKGHLVADPTVC